jgi:peptide/nickel transport system substrate-binding protein
MLVVVNVLFAACASGQPAPAAREQSAAPATTTTIRIGLRQEPDTGIALFWNGGLSGAQVAWMFHASLTAYDAQGTLQGRLARKVPSIADHDWVVNADGSMEVTWKLRPNVKWHDGTPLSAEDFVLGLRISRDPEIPLKLPAGLALIRDAVAPDAETLIVRWSEPYFEANQGGPVDVPAVPRHLVQDLYAQGDRKALVNSPYWTEQFVGLGPYRLGDWVRGSYTDALAFDDYYLGRPKIDRVVLRYFSDATIMATSLLAGDIDLVPLGSLNTEALAPVKQAWDPQAGGTIIQTMTAVQWARFQFRDPTAPWVRDVRVRQAIAHLLDRQTLADSFEPGGSMPADLYVSPDDPAYRVAQQRGYTKYPYDPARAARLFAEAGWTPGPDGVLADRSGQPLKAEMRVINNTSDAVQRGIAIADQLKRGGLDVPFYVIPGNAVDRMKQRAEGQGLFTQSNTLDARDLIEQFTTAEIRGEPNNWVGKNQSGYSNPEVDRLFAQYAKELDPAKRDGLYADFLKRGTDEALYLPIFYNSGFATTAFRRGIRGPGGQVAPPQPITTWNVHEWVVE